MDFVILPRSVRAAPTGKVFGRGFQLPWRAAFYPVGLAIALLLSGWTSLGAAPGFADDIQSAGEIIGASGEIIGSNADATLQNLEPLHAGRTGRPGGHSVWVLWQAPTNGLASFSAASSSFEAVVAAYAYESALEGGSNDPPNPANPFDGLEAVSRSYTGPTNAVLNAVQFPVRAGVKYRIAVDGLNGVTGAAVLDWSFAGSGTLLPSISGVPTDRALREGDSLTLSFQIQSAEKPEFRWFRDGVPIDDGEGPVLAIPSLRRDQVGKYQLRVDLEDFIFFTDTVEIQINSEGETASLARDTARDALLSGFPKPSSDLPFVRQSLRSLSIPAGGVVRGYNGSQIFNTVTARRDPGEPNHCGVAGGASYWWAYQPPAEGRVFLDTVGSGFDTVLAVYTYDPPFQGYASLISVACDVNSGPNGKSAVQFAGLPSRTYLIVVDGVNGARGQVQLNYRLETGTSAATPPTINSQPVDQTVLAGSSATFQVAATGDGTLSYQWIFNGSPMAGETNSTLVLTHVALSAAGGYSVSVSNAAGPMVSAVARLTVVKLAAPPTIQAGPQSVTAQAGSRASFSVSASGDGVLAYQWLFNSAAIPGETNSTLVLTHVTLASAGGYSVQVSNTAGDVVSGLAQLSVFNPPTPPTIQAEPQPVTVFAGGTASFQVSASGDGVLAYQWLFNNAPISGGTNATLVLTNVAFGAAGTYSVQVSNSAGRALSSPALLTVLIPPTPPSIQTAPQPLTIEAGQTATFSASAQGDAPLAWQWFKNGSPVFGATAPVYAIQAVTLEDAGLYSVSASNPAGTAQSAAAELRVVLPPALTAVSLGSSISVTVPTVSTLRYVLESAEPADLVHWRVLDIEQGNGGSLTFQSIPANRAAVLFRVRVE